MALIIVFHNDSSGRDDAANYNVTVYVNEKPIHVERVEGHKRGDGWRALVRRLGGAASAVTELRRKRHAAGLCIVCGMPSPTYRCKGCREHHRQLAIARRQRELSA